MRQVQEENDRIKTKLAKFWQIHSEVIEEIEEKAAREIFEEIEKYIGLPIPTGVEFFVIPIKDFQKLKAKHGGKK
jgi:Mg2+ and Co2+ transporter CorA